MSDYLKSDTARVAVGPWFPVEVSRSAEGWDLGSAGYAPGKDEEYFRAPGQADTNNNSGPVVEVVEYPDTASMETAERPLGFRVAMANAVQVEYTGEGQ